jgi:hypothetical protein
VGDILVGSSNTLVSLGPADKLKLVIPKSRKIRGHIAGKAPGYEYWITWKNRVDIFPNLTKKGGPLVSKTQEPTQTI